MKKLSIALCVCIVVLSSCAGRKIRGNGMLRTEAREVSAFESMNCEGAYVIQVECQAKQALMVDADENLLPLIRTEVRKNVLYISTEGNLSPSKEIRIIAAVQKLSALSVQGSARGDIGNVDNASFSVDVKGSSKLHLSGKSTEVKIDISGSSDIDAASLLTENAKVRIYGSGDIHVHASNTVDAQINGSGTVRYSGNPQNVIQGVNGSGKIEKE